MAYGGTSQGATTVGEYVITPGGLTSANYAINFVNGKLTITPPADSTAPAVPVMVAPADGSLLTSATWAKADWSDVSDPSMPVTYIYQSSNSAALNPDGSFVSPAYTSSPALAVSEIVTAGTLDGTWYWHVRAIDGVGNNSDWSNAWSVIVDNTPAPVITAETASAATQNTVTIAWTTDKPAASRVLYDTVPHSTLGTAPNYGYANSTADDLTMTTSHSVTVTGLTSGITY